MKPPGPEPFRLIIRHRPGMFIGGLGARGIHAMIDDIVTEQLQAPDARPARVHCAIHADGDYTIEVAGGVIAFVEPADFDPDDARYARRPIDERFFSLAITSAFAERLDVEVVRDGKRWTRAFSAGLALDPEQVTTTADPPLLRVRFRPDSSLFPNTATASFLALCGRASEWAAFHSHARFTIEDEREDQRRDYHYPHGLLSLAKEIEHQWAGVSGGFWRCNATGEDGSSAEAVLLETPSNAAVVHSFVNGRRTGDGGSHVDGLRSGAAAAAQPRDASEPANPFRHPDDNFHRHYDPLAGLTVLLAVRLANPQYAGATKDCLETDHARSLVYEMVQRVERVR